MLYTLFRECETGKSCGRSCISKDRRCRDELDTETGARVDAFVARVIAAKTENKSDKAKSNDAVNALASAKTREERVAIVAPLMNTMRPEEARAILDVERKGGKLGGLRRPDGEYSMPEMKLREVDDVEVDAVWDELSTHQRNLLFSGTAGAPGRGDRVKIDWDGDTERMRKSMLKAMLEQSTPDGRVIDPWTNTDLKFPADLDHIVPLAKGGTHGSGADSKGYDGSNWVWIDPRVNRNYKGDRDLNLTAYRLKLTANNPGGYEKALDRTIGEYMGKKTTLKALREGASKEIPRPEFIDTLKSKAEINSVMKGVSDMGHIPRWNGGTAEVAKATLAGLFGDMSLAAARVTRSSKPVLPGPIQQIVRRRVDDKGILNMRDIGDIELHKVAEAFLKTKSRKQMPPKLVAEIDAAPRTSYTLQKYMRPSNSDWAVGGRIPYLRGASPELLQYISDNGFSGK